MNDLNRDEIRALTQQRLFNLLHYDKCTGEFKRLVSVGGENAGNSAGSISSHGYLMIVIDYKKYSAHRLAWLYVHGEFPKNKIDHINRNRTDNRIENLRQATNSENNQNMSMSRRNTSGYQGVCWQKQASKWKVQISVNGKKLHIGIFKNIEDAVKAHADAKKRLHTFHSIPAA